MRNKLHTASDIRWWSRERTSTLYSLFYITILHGRKDRKINSRYDLASTVQTLPTCRSSCSILPRISWLSRLSWITDSVLAAAISRSRDSSGSRLSFLSSFSMLSPSTNTACVSGWSRLTRRTCSQQTSCLIIFNHLSLYVSSKLMHQPVQTIFTKSLADALRPWLFGHEAKLRTKYVHKKHYVTF